MTNFPSTTGHAAQGDPASSSVDHTGHETAGGAQLSIDPDVYEFSVGCYVNAPRFWWITVDGERVGKWWEDGRIETFETPCREDVELCQHQFCDADGNRVYSYCQRGCGALDPEDVEL